ncbi:hypothetical protein [Bacillus cereus]
MLYKKRVETTDKLFEVIKALEVLEKKYTVRKEIEEFEEGSLVKHFQPVKGSVWYIEEVKEN